MTESTSEPVFGDEDDTVEEIAEEIAEHNPDPLSKREVIEQELASRGRSDDGEELGEHIE